MPPVLMSPSDLYAHAAPSVGSANRKEYFAASRGAIPVASDPRIVTIDLLVPGKSARHCMSPIPSAAGMVSDDPSRPVSDAFRARARTHGASAIITTPPSASAAITGPGAKNRASNQSPNVLPMIAAGRNERKRLRASRKSRRCVSDSRRKRTDASIARIMRRTSNR